MFFKANTAAQRAQKNMLKFSVLQIQGYFLEFKQNFKTSVCSKFKEFFFNF